jgi:4-carboxymuconolactone decarboxylase
MPPTTVLRGAVAVVLGLLLALSAPAAGFDGPAALSDPDPTGVWPLVPEPEIVEGFDPPDSPYGVGHRGRPCARPCRAGSPSPDGRTPGVYLEFTRRYPQVAEAQGELARTVDDASPFDERTTRLLKLALAIGAEAEGAVRSNARKSLAQGVTETELRAVVLLAITTCDFPSAIAGLRWVDEVLEREAAAE